MFQSVGHDKTQVEAVFWSVQQSDFGMYYMTAENEIGSTEVPIVLHPAYDRANPPVSPNRVEQLQQLFAESADGQFTACFQQITCWLPCPGALCGLWDVVE